MGIVLRFPLSSTSSSPLLSHFLPRPSCTRQTLLSDLFQLPLDQYQYRKHGGEGPHHQTTGHVPLGEPALPAHLHCRVAGQYAVRPGLGHRWQPAGDAGVSQGVRVRGPVGDRDQGVRHRWHVPAAHRFALDPGRVPVVAVRGRFRPLLGPPVRALGCLRPQCGRLHHTGCVKRQSRGLRGPAGFGGCERVSRHLFKYLHSRGCTISAQGGVRRAVFR